MLVIGALQPATSAQAQSFHGALPMDQQLTRLDQILPKYDVTKAPPGVDNIAFALFVPKDNEMTPARVALGKKLYFATRLSADGTVA